MKIKKVMGIGLTLVAFPLFANELSLTVHNYTDKDSAVKILKLFCSGPVHITKAGKSSSTPQYIIKTLCLNKIECGADLYTDQFCSGDPIAHIVLNTNTLISKVEGNVDSHYRIDINGREITLRNAT